MSAKGWPTRALCYLSLLLLAACTERPAPKATAAQTTAAPSSAVAAPSPRVAAPPSRLRLASWNIAWLNAEEGAGVIARDAADYERLARYAARLDADVVALAEIDGAAAARRIFNTAIYDIYVTAGSGPQQVGFAYKKALNAEVNADYAALNVGDLRVGADLSVPYADGSLRFLAVHLKSGCFAEPLDSESKACRKLRAQLPQLEAWVDARARDALGFAVMGDFNRRLFATARDEFWRELDDSEPEEADLFAPTAGQRSQCWGGESAHFIDHIVLSRRLAAAQVQGSFAQQRYDAADQRWKKVLSDHCPLSIDLQMVGPSQAPATVNPAPTVDLAVSALPTPTLPVSVPPVSTPSATTRPVSTPPRAGLVKGNVSRGRKLYHLPGCPNYERVIIDPGKGEAWFNSEADAEAHGFSKASDCQ